MIDVLMHWTGGWGPWFLVFPLFWLAVVTLLFLAFRRRGPWGRWDRWSSAEDVLAERYARGEISADEYRERMDVLRHRSG